jgi:hypothetical protein
LVSNGLNIGTNYISAKLDPHPRGRLEAAGLASDDAAAALLASAPISTGEEAALSPGCRTECDSNIFRRLGGARGPWFLKIRLLYRKMAKFGRNARVGIALYPYMAIRSILSGGCTREGGAGVKPTSPINGHI